MEAGSSALSFFFFFPVGIPGDFQALLPGPSVVDRSGITEPLTRTAAALSQYCF